MSSKKPTPSPPAEPANGTKAHEREDSKHGKKREREGSLDPSLNPSKPDDSQLDDTDRPSTPPVALPKKKNRLVSSPPSAPTAGAAPMPSSPAGVDRAEGSKDQEIRKGVEDLGVGEEEAAARKEKEQLAGAAAMDQGEGEGEDVSSRTTTTANTAVESGLVPSTDPDSIKAQSRARLLDDSKTTFSTTATIDSAEDVELSGPPTPTAAVEDGKMKKQVELEGGGVGDGEMMEKEKGLKRKHVVGSDASLKKVREDEPITAASASASSSSSSALPTTSKPKSSGGFLSFASSSSPFVTSTTPASSSSPFASTSSSSNPALSTSSSSSSSTSKPNIPSHHTSSFPSPSASPFTMSGPKTKTSSSAFSGSNAFSAFASASPFKTAAAAGPSVLGGEGAAGDKKAAASFGDILSNGGKGGAAEIEGRGKGGEGEKNDVGGREGDAGGDVGNGKIEAQDMVTGEEDEDTKHQVRAKLHVMDKSGGWKERGTGLCKLNIHSKTGLARLVMRAEGVYRLILNIVLFAGMSCERQDKWVRIVAMENGAVCQLAIKVGTAKAAEDLFDKIQSTIPSAPKESSSSISTRSGSVSKSPSSSTGGWNA